MLRSSGRAKRRGASPKRHGPLGACCDEQRGEEIGERDGRWNRTFRADRVGTLHFSSYGPFLVGVVGGHRQLDPGGRLCIEGGAGFGDEPECVAAENEVRRRPVGVDGGE